MLVTRATCVYRAYMVRDNSPQSTPYRPDEACCFRMTSTALAVDASEAFKPPAHRCSSPTENSILAILLPILQSQFPSRTTSLPRPPHRFVLVTTIHVANFRCRPSENPIIGIFSSPWVQGRCGPEKLQVSRVRPLLSSKMLSQPSRLALEPTAAFVHVRTRRNAGQPPISTRLS
jgi:hypothetical protein